MTEIDLTAWGNFFFAGAGAAATLAGLLFVAMSINLSRIISFPSLSVRAAETMIGLGGTLAISMLALVPHQTCRVFGARVLVLGTATWVVPFGMQLRALARRLYVRKSHILLRMVIHQGATLPLVAGGVWLVRTDQSGLYLLVPGVITAMLSALMNAWVLLIEILR